MGYDEPQLAALLALKDALHLLGVVAVRSARFEDEGVCDTKACLQGLCCSAQLRARGDTKDAVAPPRVIVGPCGRPQIHEFRQRIQRLDEGRAASRHLRHGDHTFPNIGYAVGHRVRQKIRCVHHERILWRGLPCLLRISRLRRLFLSRLDFRNTFQFRTTASQNGKCFSAATNAEIRNCIGTTLRTSVQDFTITNPIGPCREIRGSIRF